MQWQTIAFYVPGHTHTMVNIDRQPTTGSRMYCHLFTMPKLRLSNTLIFRPLCRCFTASSYQFSVFSF